jgi:hypothetical protein
MMTRSLKSAPRRIGLGLTALVITACGGGFLLDVDDADAWVDSISPLAGLSSGEWIIRERIYAGDTAWVVFIAKRRDGEGIGGVAFGAEAYDTTILRPLPDRTKKLAGKLELRPDFVWRAERPGLVSFVFYNATGITRSGMPTRYIVLAEVVARR